MKQYSNDFRKKVIEYYKKCNNKSKTAETFSISRKTVIDWVKLEKEGKLHEYKKPVGQKSKVDLEKLEEYIISNPQAYYREIGKAFKISTSLAQYLAVKLGFKIKKKDKNTKRQMKKNKKNL